MVDEQTDDRSLYTRLRQFFQPYYRPKPKKPKVKSADTAVVSVSERDAKPAEGAVAVNGDTALLCKVLNYPGRLDNAIDFKKKPSLGVIWAYHDANVHQLFARFDPGDGWRCRERDDAARGQLKPLIYPKNQGRFDRTHLIPIGYHGSENDNRLVVGWNPRQNQQEFAEFEKVQKKRKEPIYWQTLITKTPAGANWRYRIYDARTGILLDSLERDIACDLYWEG